MAQNINCIKKFYNIEPSALLSGNFFCVCHQMKREQKFQQKKYNLEQKKMFARISVNALHLTD